MSKYHSIITKESQTLHLLLNKQYIEKLVELSIYTGMHANMVLAHLILLENEKDSKKEEFYYENTNRIDKKLVLSKDVFDMLNEQSGFPDNNRTQYAIHLINKHYKKIFE